MPTFIDGAIMGQIAEASESDDSLKPNKFVKFE